MWRFLGRMWQKTSQDKKIFSCARATSQKCDKCDASRFLSPKKVTIVTSLTQIWDGKLGRNPGETDPSRCAGYYSSIRDRLGQTFLFLAGLVALRHWGVADCPEVADSVEARPCPQKTADINGLRYSPHDPHYGLGPVHTSLHVRVTWDWWLGHLPRSPGTEWVALRLMELTNGCWSGGNSHGLP